jgi:hypothetical protein
MSLETKIEALTLAINALTSSMNLATNEVVALKEPAQEIAKTATPEPTPTPEPTTDDIKALCLELSRNVSGGKLLAKGILIAAGATKAADVKESERLTVVTKLKAELG